MSAEADTNEGETPDPHEARQRVATRLREAGMSDETFIDVDDGEKRSTVPHTDPSNRHPPENVCGNYGIYATGDDPGGLVDLDVDDYDDGADPDALAALADLPETFTVESPHTDGADGGHRFYRVVPGESHETAQDALDAVTGDTDRKAASPTWGDLKVSNGYVVGPGSQLDGCGKEWCDNCATPDGGYYRISADRPIAEITTDVFADVLRADPNVRDDSDSDSRETSDDGSTPDDGAVTPPTGGRPDTGLSDDELLTKATDADNGDTFTRLWAGDATGYDTHSEAQMALANLLEFWTGDDDEQMLRLYRRSDMPRDEDDVRKFKNYDMDTARSGCTAEDYYDPDYRGGGDGQDALGDAGEWDEWGYVRDRFKSGEGGTTMEGYNAAVDAALTTDTYTRIRENDAWYWYDPDMGIHTRPGKEYLKEQLSDALAGHMNTKRESNIVGRMRPRVTVGKDEFEPPAGKAAVGNGVLDLDSHTLEPHSPDYAFTSALGCDYDPDADADEWRECLRKWVPDDRPRATLQEYAGYCLDTSHARWEKALFCVGPTNSGKSTFADTIAALFGDTYPSVASLSPQEVAHGRFSRAQLLDAAVNIRNDINSTKIEDSGTLKTVISAENVKMERKNKPVTRGRSTAKHIYTANWVPRVVGEDESLYRRLLIVEFPHTVPREDRDRLLKDRLADPEMLSGILNWALEGRDRLYEQGGFTRDRPLQETRMKWLSWRAAPLRFLFSQCNITGDSEDTIDKAWAYQAYKEWATRENVDIHPQKSMTHLWMQVPYVETNKGDFCGIDLVGDRAKGWIPPDA